MRLEIPAIENKGYEQQECLERWPLDWVRLSFQTVPYSTVTVSAGSSKKEDRGSELADLTEGWATDRAALICGVNHLSIT